MKKIKILITALGLLIASLVYTGSALADTETLTGFISFVGKDHINLDNTIYHLKSSIDGVDMNKALMGNKTTAATFNVTVWWKGQQLTYETIQASGPIKKASVTLEDGLVKEIRILEAD